MKKLVLSVVLTTMIAAYSASAQTGESVKNMKTARYILTAQSSSSDHHMNLMDKIQMETEELIMTIAPPPLLSLAHLLDKKIDAGKTKRANRKNNPKKA